MKTREWLSCIQALWRFRGYQPQAVTPRTFEAWISQFEPQDRVHVVGLLKSIKYVSEKEVLRALLDMNFSLLDRLEGAGIPAEKIIYVQVHDAGSSSPVMLNLLRDRANLEKRNCKFVDSNNVLKLSELTNTLEEGAIIYIDDFAGTGNQFCKVRNFIAEYIIGNFSEFLLVVGGCEEAIHQLGKVGVEPVVRYVHSKVERPLHPSSTILDPAVKERLRKLCRDIDAKEGLGYHELSTMIVLYRNAPNTVPLLFRGSDNQSLRKGIFPRFSDLPVA